MMTTNEIRKAFLDFFAGKGHKIVPSDSLVPKEDPTVLFTTAGMQQFKRQFLGQIEGFTRAASSQKCLRTDDLNEVGKTPYHHTFFEMLGNFSFGDYFKKEAITWAWEFLTKTLQISEQKLWVSVYREDDEAAQIWLEHIGIPPEKLVRLGDKSNFWPSEAKQKGPNGPCGPCSEIFYDYGKNPNCRNPKCNPACDCGRFSEVWNLVFTQYNRKEGGVLEPLPKRNIDTGMGLERLAAVIQNKKTNFEIDIFEVILKDIDQLCQKSHIQIKSQKEKNIVADHIRAIVFGITDGVIPSNENRGYVIKRLIIDASDVFLRNGAQEPLLFKLVPSVVAVMKDPYPEIMEKEKSISSIIQKVEQSYLRVYKERLPEFKGDIAMVVKRIPFPSETVQDTANKVGEVLFRYRDTYGLTRPTMERVLASFEKPLPAKIIQEAWQKFEQLMKAQQEKSRQASKMTGDVFIDTAMDMNLPKTEFTGYERMTDTARILKIFIDGKEAKRAEGPHQIRLVLDKTPFYAEAGGQVGDTGIIEGPKGKIRIIDTKKKADIFFHVGTIESGTISIGETIQAKVDQKRRLSIMRNHTATHLLQAALRAVLGDHVQQQGSLVAENRLRFDFTHPQAVTKEQLQNIENYVNACILTNDPVHKEVMPLDVAKKSGALAFFAEKYGETVRIISINGYSKEFCGGTHLDTTAQIGVFKILQESAIAQGIRRIEAVTGESALSYIQSQDAQISQIANLLKAPPMEIVKRIEEQMQRLKQLEKELGKYRLAAIQNALENLVNSANEVKNTKIICHIFSDADIATLRKASDLLKNKVSSVVIALGGTTNKTANVIVRVSDDLIKKGIEANKLVQEIAPLFDGSGGGRAQMAQAGGKNVANLKAAFHKLEEIVKSKL